MADVGYFLLEADEAVQSRQWDLAIEKLQKVLQHDPHNEEACERLAKCFAVRGLLTQVVNQYFMLMDILESKGDFDLSVEVGNWILKLQPENDKARMRMILVHRRKGDTAEVVRQSLALARVYMELNQGDQSILLLQEVSQNDPNNLEIGMELAEMYINQGLIQEGAMQLGKIANLLLEQGQLEKAAEAFRRMKLVSAEDPNLSYTLGNIYVSLGKLNEAEAEFRQILRHNLNHLDALTALGGVCQQKGQFRDAMLAFNKILSIDPQQVIAKEKLGELYHAQGNLNESIKQYLAAAQQYQASGNTSRAVTLYQRVVSLDPSNATACRELTTLGAPLEARPEETSTTHPFPQPLTSVTQTIPDPYNAGGGAVSTSIIPMPQPLVPQEAAMPMAPPVAPPSPVTEQVAPHGTDFMRFPQAPAEHKDPYFNSPGATAPSAPSHYSDGFDAVTTALPLIPEPVAFQPEPPQSAPPETPAADFNWGAQEAAEAPAQEPVPREPASGRGLAKKDMPSPGAARPRGQGSAGLMRKPGLESKTSGKSMKGEGGSKQMVKRQLGSGDAPSNRPALPDKSERSSSDSGRLTNLQSLLRPENTPPAPPPPAFPAPAGSDEPLAAPAWNPDSQDLLPPQEPLPAAFEAPAFTPAPPQPSGGHLFDAFNAIPGPPHMDTDTLEFAPPTPPPPPAGPNSDSLDVMPPLPTLESPLPLGDGLAPLPSVPPPPPLDFSTGPLEWSPPAPPAAPLPEPAQPLAAAPTQRMEPHREPVPPPLPPPSPNGDLVAASPTVELTPLPPQAAPLLERPTVKPPSPGLASPAPVDPGLMRGGLPVTEDATAVPTTPESAVDVTRLHDYIANNDLSRAFAAFNKGLESAPTNRELRQHLAQTYYQNGMLDEALSEFEALVEADPQNLRYRQQLAEGALWSSDLNRSVQSMLGYASCLQKEGSYDEAVAVLEDCVALDPGSSQARLALADLHSQLNMPNLAMYHLSTLSDIALRREDADGTIATLRRLHTMTGDAVYQQKLAHALLKFGIQDEASGQFRDMARAARTQGDIQMALRCWNQVRELTPDHEEALDNLVEIYRTLQDGEHYLQTLVDLAELHRKRGNLDKARAFLEAAVSADGRRSDLRSMLVDVYLESGHADQAMHEAQHVIESAMHARDYPQALSLMERLSAASPGDLALREQIINVHELTGNTERVLQERLALGQLYAERSMAEEAIRVYERALAIDENNVEVHYQLGMLYMDARQDLAAAETTFQRVFELDPGHTEAMKRLIAVLMGRDETTRAVAVLNRLIEVAPENRQLREQFLTEYQKKVDATPDDVKSRFTLGMLYLELNQHDKSIEQFQKTRPYKEYTLKSYNMLGLAFSRKAGYNSDDLAIKQFKKGLELSGYPEEEVNELRYNLASLLDRKGKKAEALDIYKDIYADDVNYHHGDVARRVKQIQEELGAAS